ncbi:MAG: hypothetical protein JRF54_07310 [Deltaproteobacteria bacterium]|nr:hypothetical protein [Deltaproteobacteria bacterium]
MIKGALLVVALVVVVVAFVRLNQVTLPEGAVPVVWDGEVCQHCKMHVGDPRFAAQVQTTSGDILNFDDPGCLFDYEDSPMGYGIRAVSKETPEAQDIDWAKSQVRARPHNQHGGS